MSVVQENTSIIDGNVYEGNAAFTVQSYTEINSKNGTQFECQIIFENIQSNTPQTFSFTTGSDPVIVKSRGISGEFSNINYDIYRDSTVTGGTSVLVSNLNDRNSVVNQVDVTLNPTLTVKGDLWSPYKIVGSGTNKSVSYGTPQGERILKENTSYVVEVINNDVTTIPILVVDLSWYQGQLDLDIRKT